MPKPPLTDPDDPRRRARGLAVGLPTVGTLGLTLFGFNAAQLASLAVRPFSRKAFRTFNRWSADTWWGWTVTIAQRLHDVDIVVTGDDVPPRENALVVANHQQMPDITFLMQLARRKERLGDMKWFVKESLKYVPGVGWGMQFLDCLFVSRDWAEDEETIQQTFARITGERLPVWLIMFVEGTRITPEKVEKAREFARERGWPPTDHVLVPRTKGFAAAASALQDHADAVYDVTIGYPDGVPTLWQYTQGFARRAHLHVRRYPMADLPTDGDQLAEWLRARFREKDALLAEFYESGAFPER